MLWAGSDAGRKEENIAKADGDAPGDTGFGALHRRVDLLFRMALIGDGCRLVCGRVFG